MNESTLVAWVLYDSTTDVKYIKMNPVDGSLAIFDNEEAAKLAKSLNSGTDYERCEYYSAPAVQGEQVGFCEDTALSLAERTFSTEVDEQLAEDVIQYARRLHDMYTVPQPAPEVEKLVEALEGFLEIVSDSSGVVGYHLNGAIAHWREFEEVAMADEALELYHQQMGDL